MEDEASLYSRHIVGRHNIVADSLSRDFHIPTNQLRLLLTKLFPAQTPAGLRFVRPPSEISSFLTSLRDIAIPPKVSLQERATSNLGALIAGDLSWTKLVTRTNGLMAIHQRNESPSCPHLQRLLAEMNLASQTRCAYEEELSLPLLATFVRPTGRTFGTTPL